MRRHPPDKKRSGEGEVAVSRKLLGRMSRQLKHQTWLTKMQMKKGTMCLMRPTLRS